MGLVVLRHVEFSQTRDQTHVPYTGEQVLNGPGSVSHEQAMQKARREYRRFQVKALSPVEVAYLETIKSVSRIAKRKGKPPKDTNDEEGKKK